MMEAKRIWSVERQDNAVPLRAELLPITGAVSDSRARAIDPRRYERRAPKRIALLIVLLLSVVAWGLVWQLGKLVLQLWRWAEPALGLLAGLVGGAVFGMFLIGIGLLG